MNIIDLIYDKIKYKYLSPNDLSGGTPYFAQFVFPNGVSAGKLISFTPKISGSVSFGFANNTILPANIQIQKGDEILSPFGEPNNLVQIEAFQTYDIYVKANAGASQTFAVYGAILDKQAEYYMAKTYQ